MLSDQHPRRCEQGLAAWAGVPFGGGVGPGAGQESLWHKDGSFPMGVLCIFYPWPRVTTVATAVVSVSLAPLDRWRLGQRAGTCCPSSSAGSDDGM